MRLKVKLLIDTVNALSQVRKLELCLIKTDGTTENSLFHLLLHASMNNLTMIEVH